MFINNLDNNYLLKFPSETKQKEEKKPIKQGQWKNNWPKIRENECRRKCSFLFIKLLFAQAWCENDML